MSRDWEKGEDTGDRRTGDSTQRKRRNRQRHGYFDSGPPDPNVNDESLQLDSETHQLRIGRESRRAKRSRHVAVRNPFVDMN